MPSAMQDAVARAPKFLCLYKKTGQRVIINHSGDMLVRPSFIETSLFKKPFGELAASRTPFQGPALAEMVTVGLPNDVQ